MNARHLPLLGLLLLGTCGDDPRSPPVKDKAYYSAHRDELEAENRRCREAPPASLDECARLGAMMIEIDKEEIGSRTRAR